MLALVIANASSIDLPVPTTLESWEGTIVNKKEGSEAGWYISDNIHDNITITASSEHVTSGKQSLVVESKGGWSQILIYRENSTDMKPAGIPLYKQLEGKLTLNLDVYFNAPLEWAKVELAVQGNALPWTQLHTNSLPPGATNVKYLIPPKIGVAISKCDQWFQLIIIVNAGEGGKIYLDTLGAE